MTEAFETEGVPKDLAQAFRLEALASRDEVGQGPSSSPVPGLEELHATLDAEGPMEQMASLSTRVRWVLAGSLLFGFVAVVLVSTGRADIAVYPRGRMVLDLVLLLAPLVLALSVSLRPLTRPALPGSRRLLVVGLGIVGVGVLLGLPMAHALHPASLEGTGDMFIRRARGCFGFGLSFAVLATLGMGLLSRNGAKRWLPGALGVLAAGLMGLVALYFHCPITHPEHLWAGHATVVLPVLAVLWAVRRVDG